MNPARQLVIQKSEPSQKPVVYVMSRDQRSQDNHALLAAQALANKQNVPLYVLFVLKKLGVRSREHYEFMLSGLQEVSRSLSTYNIPLVLRSGNPSKTIADFAKEIDAGALFFDFSPLAGARSLVKAVAGSFDGSVTVVDTHNIIPVWVASDKKEFAAHTMRGKVHKNLDTFLTVPPLLQKQSAEPKTVGSLSFDDAREFIQSVPKSGIIIGVSPGETAAKARLKEFIETGLETYALQRNNISEDRQSGLSPYLHFGHISSLRVALEVIHSAKEAPLLLREARLASHAGTPSRAEGMDALLEELIVRKELADNFCLYSSDYVSLKAAPQWAQKSLAEHAHDPREFTYTVEQLETAATHDSAWNAAQLELTRTGKMHGYMRMYWAKKILEWSAGPDAAVQAAIYLNDKYSIDGGDPNGYVGILWSIAGLHDRPWFERPVFGKVRYMNEAGLRRKFSVDDYIKRIMSL